MTLSYFFDMMTFRVDPGPETFSCLLVTRLFGPVWGIVVLALGKFVPDCYSGRLDTDSIMSIFFDLILIFIFASLREVNFGLLGSIAISLKFLVGLMIMVTLHTDPREILFEWGASFAINILLFSSFGNLILGVFS
jgi:hypothetical protein